MDEGIANVDVNVNLGNEDLDKGTLARKMAMNLDKTFDPNAFRARINGVLEHELLVGDSTFIPTAARIPIPFSPFAQYNFSIAGGMSTEDAKLLTIARVGLLTWYSNILAAVDQGEAFPVEEFMKLTVKTEGQWKVRGGAVTAARYGTWIGVVDSGKDVAEAEGAWYTGAASDQVMFTEVTPSLILLHMKDVALLVAMNLVRTQHHYQTNINQTFLAMEQKRFGKKVGVFNDTQRGIMYHDAIHPFTQASKLMLYAKVLTLVNSNALAADTLFNKLDGVVIKRVPVVPAGAAWLSAGISVMHEIIMIPGIGDQIPDEIKGTVNEATKALDHCRAVGRVDQAKITKFMPLAAFAYGILKEIAPEHSAIRAPSLKKIADQHVGITIHANAVARNYLRAAR